MAWPLYVSLVTPITTRLLASRVAMHNPVGTTTVDDPTIDFVAFQVVAASLLLKQIVQYHLGQVHQKAISLGRL
jgi:hypothetical protein